MCVLDLHSKCVELPFISTRPHYLRDVWRPDGRDGWLVRGHIDALEEDVGHLVVLLHESHRGPRLGLVHAEAAVRIDGEVEAV